MKSPFLAERVGIVDKVGRNLLVRGTIPLVGDDLHWAYNEIADAIKVDLKGYKILDVCLIDNVGERWAFAPEMKAFGVDPDAVYPETYWPPYLQPGYNSSYQNGTTLTTEGVSVPGSIVWWPIEGLPDGQDAKVYLTWPGWNLSGLVDHLISLSNHYAEPTLIYFHCMVGSDRTGAAHIGYLMKHRGMVLADAIEAASKVTKAPPPRSDYMTLIQAYATYIGR